MQEWWSKVRNTLRRKGLDDELAEEMRAHLDLMADEQIAGGASPEEARARARREFGNRTLVSERAREAWRFRVAEMLWRDLRYAFRAIRKAPSFSLVLIATLALGIGANTAIFSVVYSVLLKPMPYPASERLVVLGESTAKARGFSVSWMNYQHWRQENHSFEDMAAYVSGIEMTLTGRGDAVLTRGCLVTSNFFHLTGWQPFLGRLFGEADDRPGAPSTVLVSYEFWKRSLGSDTGIVGQTVALNNRAFQVIGVLPPGVWSFFGKRDYYLPLGITTGNMTRRSQHGSTRALALLKPGVSLAAARANLDEIMQQLAKGDPGPEDDHRAYAISLSEDLAGDVRTPLMTVMGAVGLVLLLACANVASLLMVRNTSRAREMAIRTAIGAGRARLLGQLLTENLTLAALGGGLGLWLAYLCVQGLVLAGPRDIPRLAQSTLDVPVLLFAVGLTMVVGLLAGAAPAFTAGAGDLTVALREGSLGSGAGRRGHALRNGLVVGEIAITLVLTFASGLLLRSLMVALTSYPGFAPDHVLALEIQVPSSRYKTDDALRQYYGQLTEGLRGQAGVTAVGATNCPPSAGDCGDYWYSIAELAAPPRDNVPLTLLNTADANYFQAMRIPLVAGRGFTAADQAGGPRAAVVNEVLSKRWWANPQMALGHKIKLGGPYMEGPTFEIVGVAGNVSQNGLDTAPEPEVYFAFEQRPAQRMVLMIRTAGAPANVAAGARRVAAALDRNVPIRSLRPFEDWLGEPLERRRFNTMLLGAFAALAMLLAAVGIYGVLDYWVRVREREIAIRLALGAQRRRILQWAGSHAMRLAVLGVALGWVAGWGASRWMKSLVFGVAARNPGLLFGAGAAVLVMAALAASLPLWRATRVNAVTSLHDA